MARHRASYEHPGDDDVNEIIGNGSLSEHYLALARDLDVMEAKVREYMAAEWPTIRMI